MEEALELLRNNLDKEITEFRNSYNDMERIKIYNDYYIIGFYEEYFEMLMSDYAERYMTENVAEWLAKFKYPLGFLYDEWLSVDGAFSHCWADMIEFIREEYEAEED